MKPTDSELSVLSILWKAGPSTVREVNETLNKLRKVGYTNTLKIMQIMHEKGILHRDETTRSHVYSAVLQPEEVRQDLVTNMVNSAFEGKTSNLLLHALGNYKPSQQELEAIKSMIEKLESDE